LITAVLVAHTSSVLVAQATQLGFELGDASLRFAGTPLYVGGVLLYVGGVLLYVGGVLLYVGGVLLYVGGALLYVGGASLRGEAPPTFL